MVHRRTINCISDIRGFVFEPLEGEHLVQQKNVHVVITRPGAVRGNHYHKVGTEVLAVCGPALVKIKKGKQTEKFTIAADTICQMEIPPMVSHAIQNTGKTDNLLIAFNTQSHDPDHPDTVPDLLIGSHITKK